MNTAYEYALFLKKKEIEIQQQTVTSISKLVKSRMDTNLRLEEDKLSAMLSNGQYIH